MPTLISVLEAYALVFTAWHDCKQVHGAISIFAIGRRHLGCETERRL